MNSLRSPASSLRIVAQSIRNHSITFNIPKALYTSQNRRTNNTPQNAISSSRFASSEVKITTNSWASERLQEKGETLEKVPDQVEFLSDETLVNPSDKVRRLCTDILSLNMVEVNQLLKALTVTFPYISICQNITA